MEEPLSPLSPLGPEPEAPEGMTKTTHESHRGLRWLLQSPLRRMTVGRYRNHDSIWPPHRDALDLIHMFGPYYKFGDQRGRSNPSKPIVYKYGSSKVTYLLFEGPNLSEDGENTVHRVAYALRDRISDILREFGVDFGHLVVLDVCFQVDEHYKEGKGWWWKKKQHSADRINFCAQEMINITEDFGAEEAVVIAVGGAAVLNAKAVVAAVPALLDGTEGMGVPELESGTPFANYVEGVYDDLKDEDSDDGDY